MINLPAKPGPATTISMTLIVLAIVGAITYLASLGVLGAGSVESILILILTGAGAGAVVSTTGAVVERNNKGAAAPPVVVHTTTLGPDTATAATPGPAMPRPEAG